WSPDGRWIAFTAREDEAEEEKEAQEKGRDVEIEDGPATHTHLWLLDVTERTARRLTGGSDARAFTVQSFAWSPDGARIAFAAVPAAHPFVSWRSDGYLIRPDDSTAAPRRLTPNEGPDGSPVWSADGREIYVQGHGEPGYRVGQSRLFRVDVASGRAEDVTPGDLDPNV